MKQKVFQVEFSCSIISKHSRETFSLFHFIVANSFASLQQKGKNDNVSLVLFVGFCIFLGFVRYSAEQIFKPRYYKSEPFVIWEFVFLSHVESAPICLKLKVYLLITKYFFRVLMPQSNQTAGCPKLHAVKMVSQSYQIFLRSDFANKNTLLIRSYLFIYLFWKEKMEKMDKTVRFPTILVCSFIM